MTDRIIDWIDTGKQGAEVYFARFAEADSKFLVIKSQGDLDLAMKLRGAGFIRYFNYYFRKQDSTTLSEMRRFFPEARVCQKPIAQTRVAIQDRMPDLLAALPETGTVTALAPMRDEQSFTMLNAQQVKYVPASRGGTPIAAIPVDLAQGTFAALQRVRDKRGDIDEWLCKELQYGTLEKLWKAASPEQVDAVALSIDNALEGSGTICADATGLGKGRVGALLFRWCALNKRLFVFLTEKANLFTDFVRDIIDTDSAHLMGTPYLFNNNARILDQATNEVLYQSLPDKENKKVISSGKLPKGTTLAMASYSQVNRAGSAKTKFFIKICEGAHVHADESHNATGEDSNQAQAVEDAKSVASSVSDSSATHAKRASSFRAYKRLLPPSIAKMDNMVEVLSAGGVPLLEALSRMLAATGRLIRREHDLSDMEIVLDIDAARKDEHEALSDRLAPILSRVSRLSMDVGNFIEEKNQDPEEQLKKRTWASVHWGVRVSMVIQHFIAACKIPHAIERGVEALLEDKKPVFVFQATMEQVLRDLMTDEEDGKTLHSHLRDAEGNPRLPQFKDLLRLLVDRTMTAQVREGREDPVRTEIEDPELMERADALRAMIDEFPELPINPMDEVMRGIEERGRELHAKGVIDKPWVMGEISGRSIRVTQEGVQAMAPVDRNVVINNFQNGEIDGVALTNAASTGLSLHNHARARDQRTRKMFEFQIPADPVARIQFWGRIKRRGGLTEPEFACLATAMSIELRNLAAQNRKIREVGASVSGSGDAGMFLDVVDPINSLGNKIAQRLLRERPQIAFKMGISLKLDDEDAEAELYYVNRLLSRLALLRSSERDAVYFSFMDAYEDAFQALAAKGLHPTRPRELEGEWKVVARQVFNPDNPEDGPVFGAPVYLTTIEREQFSYPIDRTALMEILAERRRQSAKSLEQRQRINDHLVKHLPDLQRAALPKRLGSVASALMSPDTNMVKIVTDRIIGIRAALRDLSIGGDLIISSESGNPERGVVIGFSMPTEVEDYDKGGHYFVEYLLPGDSAPRKVSLATLWNDPNHKFIRMPDDFQKRYTEFADLPAGRVKVQRQILDGNPFVAAKLAVEHEVGSVTRIHLEDEGMVSAVLIPRDRENVLQIAPGSTTSSEVALRLIREGGTIYSKATDFSSSMSIERDGPDLKVTIPGKVSLNKPYLVDAITSITGEFVGDWRGMVARVDPARFHELAEAMGTRGMGLNFDSGWRQAALRIAEEVNNLEQEQPGRRPAA